MDVDGDESEILANKTGLHVYIFIRSIFSIFVFCFCYQVADPGASGRGHRDMFMDGEWSPRKLCVLNYVTHTQIRVYYIL